MEAKLDCGDNSCEFAENKTGMRTNGGCRCLKDLDFSRRMAVRRYLVALREENARLCQRIEELERAPRCCADTIPPGCRTCRCADAAEAKLAKVVEALERVLRFEASFGENDIPDDDREFARAALAAAKGGE